MRKIYGIFRGFPGLGRVSAGIALLKDLEKQGYQIGAISYYQGSSALRKQGIPILLEYEPEDRDITSIGINPITEFSSKVAECIKEGEPDIIIFDGEPLLQSVLGDVFPKSKIISLLNPSDLYNETLPEFKINFYHKNYLACGNAIVHGIGLKNETVAMGECNVYHIPTIIREEVLSISSSYKASKRIVGILGGGSVNSSKSFIKSTVDMGVKIASIAKIMNQYDFDIYCNDDYIKQEIEGRIKEVANVEIISNYTAPKDIYDSACFAIVRAGRNVASELLYLNIPGLLIATDGDYRSQEQEKNIRLMIEVGDTLFDKFTLLEDDISIVNKINTMIEGRTREKLIHPGNEISIDIIKKVLEE